MINLAKVYVNEEILIETDDLDLALTVYVMKMNKLMNGIDMDNLPEEVEVRSVRMETTKGGIVEISVTLKAEEEEDNA